MPGTSKSTMHLFLVASFAPSSNALVPSSFLLLLVRHLLLVAMHLFLVALGTALGVHQNQGSHPEMTSPDRGNRLTGTYHHSNADPQIPSTSKHNSTQLGWRPAPAGSQHIND